MSTPACIGVLYPEKAVCVYLSASGYPEWAGNILLHHWNDQVKAEQLLEGGNLYHLDAAIGEPHDRFAAQITQAHGSIPINKGWCQFKRRDHDRRFPSPMDEGAQTFQHLETLLTLNGDQGTPWTYLFHVQAGKWFVYDAEHSFDELTEEYIERLACSGDRA